MSFTVPSVVIENGSSTSRAGFSNDELPPLVFTSHYAQNSSTGETYFGDDIYIKNKQNNFKDLEIYSLSKDGLIYNWDNLEKNWQHIYNKLSINHEDYPLVTTEPVNNTKKNKKQLVELAFEKFNVPSFSILKTPLCITYGLGRSNGLIVDIGGPLANVTGIIDGNILPKSIIKSKYAGDFLNFQIFNYLKQSYYSNDDLISKKIQNLKLSEISESFKNYDADLFLFNDFKNSVFSMAQFQLTPQNIENFGIETKNYKLPDGRTIGVNAEQLLIPETLFKPTAFVSNMNNNNNNINNNGPVLGLVDLILSALNKYKDTPEIITQLLTNIIVTGGGSMISDIEKRIYFELTNLLPNFQVSCYAPLNLLERHHAAWIGAGILSSMNNFDGFLTKSQYEEFGEDAIWQRFK